MQIIKELLNNSFYYSKESSTFQEVERIIELQEQKREAMLVYSNKVVSKSKLFKNALSKKEGDKIFIDFKKNSYMSCFPGYFLVKEIYKKLDEYNIPHHGVFPVTPVSDVLLDVETHYNNLISVLKTDLYTLELDRPLYILISNIDLPYDNDFSLTFYRHFLFDKRTLPNNLHVFLTTSNNNQKEENSYYLSNVEMDDSKDNPKLLFKEMMDKLGKKVNDEVLLTANPTLRLYDYMNIAGYVINYCGPKEYDYALSTLLNKNNTDEILLFIFDDFFNRLSSSGKVIFCEALLDLYMFNLGLTKDQIIYSGRYLLNKESHYLADYNEVSEDEKSLILAYLDFYTTTEEDRLIMNDRIIRDFIGTNAMLLTNVVTSNYKERLYNAVDHAYGDNERIEVYDYRGNYHMIKSIYLAEFDRQDRFSKKNIVKYAIFELLRKRLLEVIDDYVKGLEEGADYSRRKISDKDIYMLAYIERSTVIFESGNLFTAFDGLLSNKNLMYYLVTKSRRMVRRIVKRCIDTGFEYQRRISGGITDRYGPYVPIAGMFSYLFFGKDKEKFEPMKEELTILVADVLKESGILVNGSFKDSIATYHVTPIYDFLLTNCSSEIIKAHDSLDEVVNGKNDPDFKLLTNYIRDFSDKYQNDENIFHKLAYAFMALRTYIFLGENRKVTKEISSYLEPIMLDIKIYLEYCYYPEVYGAINMYYGRIFPHDYLPLMKLGIDLMKSQGYENEIKLYLNAFNYFASVKGGM